MKNIYFCPVDCETFKKWGDLAKHWFVKKKTDDDHRQYLEKFGLNTQVVLTVDKKGKPQIDYSSLINYIEKFCKI